MSDKKSGILVTGSHRSGTTWMGRILSLPDEVVYISEPFNLKPSTESIAYRFEHWFSHTADISNPEQFYQAMDHTVRFRFIPKQPAHLSLYRALRKTLRMHLENFEHRRLKRTPLLKDPLALFSSNDLAARYDLDVVCMIRHPLAFCSSLKKFDWKFPFDHFLGQPQLMDLHFREDAPEITRFADVEQPVVQQATLLWNLFHKVIRKYQSDHPQWHFRRHEDMVDDPVKNFQSLYQKLGLEFTDSVARQLRDSLNAKSGETDTDVYKARDASSVTQTWKSRLTQDEIDHILAETTELRHHFYPEQTTGRPAPGKTTGTKRSNNPGSSGSDEGPHPGFSPGGTDRPAG